MHEKYLSDIEAFLRKSLSEENEAVSVYEQRAELARTYADEIRETDPNLADKLDDVAYTINDIKSEEEVHIGELTEMLSLIGVSNENQDKGREEAQENIQKNLKEAEEVRETFLTLYKKLRDFDAFK